MLNHKIILIMNSNLKYEFSLITDDMKMLYHTNVIIATADSNILMKLKHTNKIVQLKNQHQNWSEMAIVDGETVGELEHKMLWWKGTKHVKFVVKLWKITKSCKDTWILCTKESKITCAKYVAENLLKVGPLKPTCMVITSRLKKN